jgi:hypothetical protein
LQNETPQTGPRTRAGKEVASRNALSHGITSPSPVLAGMEREADWRRHLNGIVDGLAPEGDLERALAERVALLLWRLHRITRYEVAVTDRAVAGTESDLAVADAYVQGTLTKGVLPDVSPVILAAAQETRVIPAVDELDKIMRYETHLHRQYIQTLHELEALQARRNGEQTHLARLDISTPPTMWAVTGRAQAGPRALLR